MPCTSPPRLLFALVLGLLAVALPTTSAASDVTLADALEEQFGQVERDATKALRAKPAKQLGAYSRLNRDVAAAIKEIKAEEPVTPGGDDVKACELASLARFKAGAASGINAAKALARGNVTQHTRLLRTAKARIAAGREKHDDCVSLGENPDATVTAWGVASSPDEFEFTETVIRMPQGTVLPGGTITNCGPNLIAIFFNADFEGVRPGLTARFVWTVNGVVAFDDEFANDRYATSAGAFIFSSQGLVNGLYQIDIFLDGVLRASSSVTRAC